MYQFTTTNVINSVYAVDYNGVALTDNAGNAVDKFKGSATELFVAKVGTFKKANIVSIHKRAYAAGVKEIAKVTVPVIASGLVARLDVTIKLSGSTQSEYTNYSLDFKKPITVEILASGVAATDATALVAQLNGLKNRFGHSYINASVNGAEITLTAKEDVQRFASIVVSKQVASPNSIIQPEYESVATGTVTTAGKIAFGDDAWMMKSVMVPTAENVRVFGISKDERPILGGNYSEYVIRYSLTKDGQDGIVSGATSVTTHVFWVKADLTDEFETELDKLGITYGLGLTVGDDTLANEATTQATVTNAIGAVTFSIVSGDSATVSAAGLITADAVKDGETVVKATDAVGNSATVTITVA